MKSQWYLLAGFIFTIIIAIFAVLNVAPVEVNFFFGTGEWPLVLVILFSTLMGIVIAGSIGVYQVVLLKRKMHHKQPEGPNKSDKPQDENLNKLDEKHGP
ncbi:LapA family protein [Sutcliffiella deserti]|uniref:LapA family protein n=1 Tax=Sutcliffiella deserti TaxID=2875501 RepID=UPI001CBDB787|nr:lipopolysaccharide assembly protein LapA domain-containing protein [Sutcliffiella deserti]